MEIVPAKFHRPEGAPFLIIFMGDKTNIDGRLLPDRMNGSQQIILYW